MRFGELFAGIGGFSLGLERAGMKCAWQVEIDPYARAVLNKHWPDVRRHDDVRTFPPTHTHTHDFSVDLICGGFPCQDISVAGKGAGLTGERSGLWHEFARIVGVLRPRYVVVENVAALLGRGMDVVLGTLSTLGYDAEWHVIPASAVGAPHRRERVWIVAYSASVRHKGWAHFEPRRLSSQPERALRSKLGRRREDVADAEGIGGGARLREGGPQQNRHQSGDCCGNVPNSNGAGRQQQRRPEPIPTEQPAAECSGWWESEPDVGRVAHGVPSRVDRLRCLGNAVVPQVVEVIGRAILAAEARMTA